MVTRCPIELGSLQFPKIVGTTTVPVFCFFIRQFVTKHIPRRSPCSAWAQGWPAFLPRDNEDEGTAN